MPHIVVEYSDNLAGLDVPALLAALHGGLAENESVDVRRIKTRAVSVADYVVGDKGPEGAFMHITLKLLPRPPEVAKAMALALQTIARSHAGPDCVVTVETVTLSPETYCA